jgi:tetratricopeptide (TPR) repeat protein
VNVLLLPLLFFGLRSGESDTFYHLAGGRWMFEHHALLDRETFSFTIPDRPWTNYYWAFECLLYWCYRSLGWAGVFLLRGLLVVGTVNLFVRWVGRCTRGALPETLAFGLMVLPLFVPRALSVRPHLFSYLFLVVALLLLDAMRRGRRAPAFVLPVLCVVWANVHGVEYPVLLATVAVHVAAAFAPHLRRHVGELLRDPGLRPWLVLALACAASFLVNPFGVELLATPRIGADTEVMAQINEMQPPPLSSFGSLFPDLDLQSRVTLHYAALAGLLLVPGWVRRRDVLSLGLFGLGLSLALDKRRFAVEFLILAVPPVAAGVARVRAEGMGRRTLRTVLLLLAAYIAAAGVATAGSGIRAGRLARLDPSFFPVGAVEFMRTRGLEGRLHCEPTIAGYVEWSLYPAVRVFMDMRTPEPFGAQSVWLSQVIGQGVSLERAAPLGIDFFLVSRDAPLAARLRAGAAAPYALVYLDQSFLLFAHERQLAGERAALRLTSGAFLEALQDGQVTPPNAPPALAEEAERLASVWPGNHLAQRGLLWKGMADGRFGEMLGRAGDLQHRFPREAVYPFVAGLALRELGRPAEAAAAFARARALDVTLLPAYPAEAETLLVIGRSEEGLKVMEEYSRHRWTTLGASDYLLIGRLRLRTRRIDAAVDAFERADWLMAPSDPGRADLEKDLALARALRARDPESRAR